MSRFEAIHFIIFIVFFVQNFVYFVECEDKRIIIYVPARVRTVHHHHHHVVLMDDPKKKTMTRGRPAVKYSADESWTSGEEGGHQQRQQHQYAYQQHQRQPHARGVHPASYTEQRKTIRTADSNPAVNVLVYPAGQLPVAHVPAYAAWPIRSKRSKVIRLYRYD